MQRKQLRAAWQPVPRTAPFPCGLKIVKAATFDVNSSHRYHLSRRWDKDQPLVYWLMLNPSRADHVRDDATIRRCMRFAWAWGYGGIDVRNLYAYIATDPTELLRAADPIGKENDSYLAQLGGFWQTLGGTSDAPPKFYWPELVVAAWGVDGNREGRADRVTAALVKKGVPLWCLGLTKSGCPRHPLRLPATTKLVRYDRLEGLP